MLCRDDEEADINFKKRSPERSYSSRRRYRGYSGGRRRYGGYSDYSRFGDHGPRAYYLRT